MISIVVSTANSTPKMLQYKWSWNDPNNVLDNGKSLESILDYGNGPIPLLPVYIKVTLSLMTEVNQTMLPFQEKNFY